MYEFLLFLILADISEFKTKLQSLINCGFVGKSFFQVPEVQLIKHGQLFNKLMPEDITR